jgi:integrase/recombinase XerD
MNANITLYLDTRRAKSDGKYPVKLRVYFNTITKHYKTGIDVSEDEFFNAYQSKKPRKEFKDLKIKLQSIESNAEKTAGDLEPFSFAKFERDLYGSKGDAWNICVYYKRYIEKLKNEERFGTASSYDLSLKSIQGFRNDKKMGNVEYLPFNEITPDFLKQYEMWMQQTGRGITTVGIYLRPLRALFNMALQEGDITPDIYPFGKRKYQIPSGRKVKKALSKADLKTLYNWKLPKDSAQAKARDFWFFSYQCNGMNIKDILGLQYKNIQGDIIVFTRTKTKNTTKTNLKPIIVPITDFTKQVIKKYGNPAKSKETYIFPVYFEGITEQEKFKKAGHFAKYINLNIKNLAEAAGVNTDISTYWARHSFTTNAIRSGASMEFIQDSLGHQDMKTTMNYWGGFEESVKRDISEKIMDFA